MTRHWIAAAALAVALAAPAWVGAHEGHVHKVMGTVVARQDTKLEVKTTDGKTVTITLNEKTSVVRGKAKSDLASLKAGERVVVDIGNGQAPVTAREIRLGDAVVAAKK